MIEFLNSSIGKKLKSNLLSLSVLQFANYAMPLLTIPYLVRILGPDYFGLLAFATAVTSFFVLVTDYGFNLSATRQISIHRKDHLKINDIFCSVMLVKIALLMISFILLILLIYNFEKFGKNWEVYILSFGVVIGQVLFPVWFFQGKESMRYLAYINIIVKTFFTILVFIFVQENSDYLLVPLYTSLGFIISGIISLYIVKRNFNVRFSIPRWEFVKFQITDGWHVFFSSISINLYTTSTIVILGLLTNNTVVGFFSAAEKIIQAIKGMYFPFSQAIYPLISKKVYDDKKKGLLFTKKIILPVGIIMFFLSLTLFLFSEYIVLLFLGGNYTSSVLPLQIMAFIPFFATLSNIFGIQIMLNMGYKAAFSKILAISGIIGVILNYMLILEVGENGASISIMLVEIFVTISMYIFLKYNKVF